MRLFIKNGRVIDPKNKLDSKLNLLIDDGKIVEISFAEHEADIVIDAVNQIICPGFVDIHMHEDPYDSKKDKFEIGIFECMAKMGVTTAIGGNCGVGPMDGSLYLDAVDKHGAPVNVGLLVAHNSLRQQVNQKDKYKPVQDETKLFKMKFLAEEQLEKGLLGISFGIRYIPGITEKELLTISEAAINKHKIVAAHIRDDAQGVIDSTKELIKIGQKLDVKIQNSHIGSMGAYGQMEELLRLMDYYRMNGIDIGFDCYPYSAFSTGIGETTYDDGFLERYNTTYESIEVAEGEYAGQRLNKSLFTKLRKEKPQTITIAHVMDENEIEMAITHPNTIVASDGFMHNLQGHPRASGTFPRVISKYVKENKTLTLNEAIAKMTIMPAERLGIKKGSLEIGRDGDIVIFNLEKIQDASNFERSFLPPQGISRVIINGKIAVENNKVIGDSLGKSVRK